jgi:hypothetical protein
MKNLSPCISKDVISNNQITLHCTVCGCEMDYITSLVSENPADTVYICFESIKQKIFVYGKYLGGKYGAMEFSHYYTKEDCSNKTCENDIRKMLASLKKDEYSRFITCNKGNLESIILTKDIIDGRKKDLLFGRLNKFFNNPNSEKKYYCHEHAAGHGFRCRCGSELIQLGSEKHRDLTGMEDRNFIETFLPEILSL